MDPLKRLNCLFPLLFIKWSEVTYLSVYSDGICYMHPVTAKESFEEVIQDIDK